MCLGLAVTSPEPQSGRGRRALSQYICDQIMDCLTIGLNNQETMILLRNSRDMCFRKLRNDGMFT